MRENLYKLLLVIIGSILLYFAISSNPKWVHGEKSFDYYSEVMAKK